MNNTITSQQLVERLNWRYATKQFDPKRKISTADWAALEEALLLSPSSGGLEPWKFIVITDPDMRAKLLPASFGQPQITAASHLVVFASKTNLSEADVDALINRTATVRGVPTESLAAYRNILANGLINSMDGPARIAWARTQTFIPLGVLLTSAAMLGIDACPMGGFNGEQYDEILGLKKEGFASAVIATLGYRDSADKYAQAAKVRFAKEKVFVHI